MMSRPLLLVFLLIILIITSQFEWRQPLIAELEAAPTVNQRQNQISKREEVIKEKVHDTIASIFVIQSCLVVMVLVRCIPVIVKLLKFLDGEIDNMGDDPLVVPWSTLCGSPHFDQS